MTAALSCLRTYGLGIAMALAFCTTAAAQERPENALQISEADMIRAEIAREGAALKEDIATMDRFIDRQASLLRMAMDDREDALRQRLPMYECLASSLAPVCQHLTGMFAPDAENVSTNVTP